MQTKEPLSVNLRRCNLCPVVQDLGLHMLPSRSCIISEHCIIGMRCSQALRLSRRAKGLPCRGLIL